MTNMVAILVGLVFILSFSPTSFAAINNNFNTDPNPNPNPDDGLQTYIVHVRKPEKGPFAMKLDIDKWYQTFLPPTIANADDGSNSRMVCTFKHVLSGFAARLTVEEVKAMEKKRGFLSARVERIYEPQTTHSPNFMGLHQNFGLWKDSNLGKGMIIGVLDTGAMLDHPSFSDEGMPPPPARWKGKCNFAGCNNKVIGARNFFSEGEPPVDNVGHGTHTASTAAGNFVYGANLFGQVNGTAAGMAPLAHLAIYKVCEKNQGCPETKISSAMDAAVADGVDVLSLSLGTPSVPFYDDSMAQATFTAAQKGIFVSTAAGNSGPEPSTISNEAPWMLTAGASSIDRLLVASTVLGNQEVFEGQSLAQPKDFTSEQLPLVFAGDGCNPDSVKNLDVKGKVLVCQLSSTKEKNQVVQNVKDAGAAAMILNDGKQYRYHIEPDVLPVVHLNPDAMDSFKAYINSTSSPTVSIVFKGTVIGKKTAPEVARFSSRGPGVASSGILKPDIIGPGVGILAASPFKLENTTDTKMTFQFLSGTSMSCPHLSGIAALLKSVHPDWSTAAIKSAMMTTADIVNLEGKPIVDHDNTPANVFAIGAGHVNPPKANDPGLIYDLSNDDYIAYLCGLKYTDDQVEIIIDSKIQCSTISSVSEAALNYPSFSISLGSDPQTYNRTVTNVGEASSSYVAQIVAPKGVDIVVQPDKLSFTEKNQKATYSVTFTKNQEASGGSSSGGYISWVSDKHTVRSPIAVRFQ